METRWSSTSSAAAAARSASSRYSVSRMGSGGGGVPMFTAQNVVWVLRMRSPTLLKGGGAAG